METSPAEKQTITAYQPSFMKYQEKQKITLK